MRTKQSIESWLKSQCLLFKASLTVLVIAVMMFGRLSMAEATQQSDEGGNKEESVLAQFGFEQTAQEENFTELEATEVPDKSPLAEMLVRESKPSLAQDRYNAINNGTPPVPTESLLAQGVNTNRLAWPMRRGIVSSRFGWRWGRMHNGTDIAAPHGTPIYAAAGGKVSFSGWMSGYGKLVEIEHADGTRTRYGHCSELLVNVGANVQQGAIIGKVGSTGRSTGPHLHFEVLQKGVAKNPEHVVRETR